LNPARRDTLLFARFATRVRRGLGGASAAMATTDGRWALVSTSMAALVSGAIAWMAIGMMPVDRPMVAPGRSSLPYALFMKLIRASEPQIANDNSDNANPNPGVESRTVTLDSGDTLAGMLEDVGISPQDANAVVAAMGKNFDARLLSLHFSPSIEQEMTVTRTTEGTYTAELVKKELQAHNHRAGGTIDSSLYLAAMQAGIPADVVVDMIRMFSYKVDFQRDLHPGDKFEVYYDYYYTPDGTPAKYGAISYAMMTLGGKEIPMYRFQPEAGEPAEYFDGKGESAKGLLMKTPVDGARISSGFGSRFHPILGYTRMHKGVDFAVPTGTPVMAAGAGTIQFMGRASGYGNFVKISHGNGYSTDYGHLSRFAPGMRSGARVRQGQVFAYSGMSGMATGPHLHYEILVNKVQVNPLTVKMAQGRRLIGKLLTAFQNKRQAIDTMVATAALETKVADNATDLRQAKAK
jgi:murein DD-endopeptidase MepM/ murein hydrolase activator NlpD